jgi:hypothetical protein
VITNRPEDYIILEDLTQGMKKPSICDWKMGRQTYESDANFKKKFEQKTVDTISTSSKLGFRICGMRIFQSTNQSYIVRDKPWGSRVKDHEMEKYVYSCF